MNTASAKGLSLLTILLLMSILSSCSSTLPEGNFELRDKIYQVKNEREIGFEKLMKSVLEGDIVYLAEKHDNRAQHEIQYRIIEELIKEGKKPVLGLEFFSIDQTGTLMRFVTRKTDQTEGPSTEKQIVRLRERLGWSQREDETWKYYYRFIELAKENKLRIFGTDLPAGILRRISEVGVGALTKVELFQIVETGFENKEYQKYMFKQLKKAHCGWLETGLAKRLYETWIARNDSMARSIIAMHQSQRDEPVVMIVGGGHTEHGLGLYERVNSLKPDWKQVNIGLREIGVEKRDLSEYFPKIKIFEGEGRPIFDFVWFTERASYEDPCLRFKEALSKMKKD